MKTLIATVAAMATVATLSAAPAMAENTAYQQQAKLQQILEMQRAKHRAPKHYSTPTQRKTERVISTRMLTSSEKAQQRLSRAQPDAANGGR